MRGQVAACLALLAACAPPPEPAAGGDETRDLVYFLRRLRTMDHLPELEASHTAMQSTWDRTGGNEDGRDFKQLAGERNVLLDVEGPGCVHRIHGVTGEALQGTRIQIFLDGAAVPLLDLPVNALFSEDGQSPLPYPLVTNRSYPGTHFPIPYARHCRIQLVNPDRKSWGMYWQVTYTRYPSGTPVQSLQLPLDARERVELDRVVQAWLDATAAPPPPPRAWTVNRTLVLRPREIGRVALAGCGAIREMRVATVPASPVVLRNLRLLIAWDGSGVPSVDVPLGYFFGHGDWGHAAKARYSSLLLGNTEREVYSRFPMPFDDGALIALDNRTEQAVQVELELDVGRCAGRAWPPETGRFHATWHRAPAATAASPRVGPLDIPAHRVLERSGRGKYVGVLLHLDWPFWPHWWGEGDWLIWTDEQGWPPSYHGTGSEEYFNSAWTLFERTAISGYITVRPGFVAYYNFHLNDAFQFQQSVRVVEETVGSLGGQLVIPLLHPRWGTTAFWYGARAEPAGSNPP